MKLGRLLVAAIILILFALIWWTADADASEKPADEFGISILRGAAENATIEDVCCGLLKDRFESVDGRGFLTGPDSPVIWLRLETGSRKGVIRFGSFAEDVTLYSERGNGTGFDTVRTGKLLPVDQRETTDIHASLPVGEGAEGVHYARINQVAAIFMAPKFQTREAFETEYSRELFWHIFLAGAAVIMMIFNLSLGILIRDRLFVLNAFSVFFTFWNGLVISGLGSSYLWGNWAQYSIGMFEITMMLGSGVSAIFLYAYLDQPEGNSRWVNAILVFPALFLLSFLLWFFLPTWVMHVLLITLNIANTLYALVALAVLSFGGDRRARLMLPTLLVILVPGNALLFAGSISDSELIIPREHVLEVMIFMEALLFSLVLAYRIRLAQTDAARAHVELNRVQRDASRQMIESVDADRRRIASDLHDTAGQGLSAISIRLKQFVARTRLSKTAKSEIDEIAAFSSGIVGDIRRISHELHPAIIDHLGWKRAIRQLFSSLAETRDINVDVDFDLGDAEPDAGQQLNLYRIIQEICSNIAKHSEATECRAGFTYANNEVQVSIADNGPWRQPPEDEVVNGASLGKVIIDQRVRLLKGDWSSVAGAKGTVVQLHFPLDDGNG